ncbi:hypothetical protein ACWER6_33850 [Streptomyces sp. NPDC004009]
MMTMFNRRVVPVLLLVQVTYVALLEFAFTFLTPDTAAIDHTDPGTGASALYAVLVTVTLFATAGGAALLGSAHVREWTPRAVRVGWLTLLGLGELAVAAMFMRNVAAGASGPDTLIGVLASVASCAIAVSCLTETSAMLRGTPA